MGNRTVEPNYCLVTIAFLVVVILVLSVMIYNTRAALRLCREHAPEPWPLYGWELTCVEVDGVAHTIRPNYSEKACWPESAR